MLNIKLLLFLPTCSQKHFYYFEFPQGVTIKIVTAHMCTIASYAAWIHLYAIFGFFGPIIGQKYLK